MRDKGKESSYLAPYSAPCGMPPKVVCVCSECRKETFSSHGHVLPGRRVSQSTRYRHRQSDTSHAKLVVEGASKTKARLPDTRTTRAKAPGTKGT